MLDPLEHTRSSCDLTCRGSAALKTPRCCRGLCTFHHSSDDISKIGEIDFFTEDVISTPRFTIGGIQPKCMESTYKTTILITRPLVVMIPMKMHSLLIQTIEKKCLLLVLVESPSLGIKRT